MKFFSLIEKDESDDMPYKMFYFLFRENLKSCKLASEITSLWINRNISEIKLKRQCFIL